MTTENSKLFFCSDEQLSYKDFQTEFPDGSAMAFDEQYRLAHLPLVAPNHPQVIQTKEGTSYNNGNHELVYSIAIPIPASQLLSSTGFVRLYSQLENSSFASKISWDTFSQRQDKLHATICGGVSKKQAPHFDADVYQKLRQAGPITVKVCGLFSGNINIGRLYLKLYPEQRKGKNMCHIVQHIFNSPPTNLYVVGLFNFIDELNAEETQELTKLLSQWRAVEFLQLSVKELWVLKSRDDLVLDGSVHQTLCLD